MNIGMPGLPGLAMITALCLSFAPAGAQTKPPESASKIKKVLLYDKIGREEYSPMDGIAAVKSSLSSLASAKGFELFHLRDDAGITLEYLKQFQVIVWNNNIGNAVPSAIARQAVIDYVDQGGGWMLICFAAYHNDIWPGLTERLGTKFSDWGSIDTGEVVLDTAARAHGELKWMVQGFPEVFKLKDLWFAFYNTVRPLPGVTVVATSRGIPGIPNVINPPRDGSGDNAYIWAREVGQGRLLYNAIGFGQHNLMGQQDSIVPRLYWENLRYAAGDYQNGCTTPGSPGFDPAARVHIESQCSPTGLTAAPARTSLVVSKGGLRMRLASPEGAVRVRLHDLRGALVSEWTLPSGTRTLILDGDLRPGVYKLEIRGQASLFQSRLLLP
jgi:hypothetical protein